MAVIWQKQTASKTYEVRSAGQTRRLYTNGVFHTQYNPGRSLTGNVWDLLSLPSFFLTAAQIRRILVLGVGGGAVIQQLRGWYPHCEVIGVELDATHLYLARRFFGLRDSRVELIRDDAINWLGRYRGLPFDIIIDDLFTEKDAEPSRVIAAENKWIRQLTRQLSKHGMLVMNFISGWELRSSCFFGRTGCAPQFKQAFRLMTPLYENQIGVFLQQPSSVNIWRKHIRSHSGLQQEYAEYRDKYQVRKLMG